MDGYGGSSQHPKIYEGIYTGRVIQNTQYCVVNATKTTNISLIQNYVCTVGTQGGRRIFVIIRKNWDLATTLFLIFQYKYRTSIYIKYYEFCASMIEAC